MTILILAFTQCSPKNPRQHLRTWQQRRGSECEDGGVLEFELICDIRCSAAGRWLCSQLSADAPLQTCEWAYTSSSWLISAETYEGRSHHHYLTSSSSSNKLQTVCFPREKNSRWGSLKKVWGAFLSQWAGSDKN